ncbi:MAG: hypothetical protein V4819_19170 [Verrucomicrobiota bacterium]
MNPVPSRDALLEQAFSDLPSKIGSFTLRRLSAGSFTLLGRLENPMIVGKQSPAAESAQMSQVEMFAAVIHYTWVHAADLDAVLAVNKIEDIPEAELRKMAFGIGIGEAMSFLMSYQDCAVRMSASLTEVDPEEGEDLGKLRVSLPAGSPVSFTPAAPAEILSGSDTFSGSCPSSEPSHTSMPPTSPTEQDASGACLTSLPDLAGMGAEQIPQN